MIALIGSSLALGFAGLLIYLFYLKKGQFDEGEDVKYQIFRDENDDK